MPEPTDHKHVWRWFGRGYEYECDCGAKRMSVLNPALSQLTTDDLIALLVERGAAEWDYDRLYDNSWSLRQSVGHGTARVLVIPEEAT